MDRIYLLFKKGFIIMRLSDLISLGQRSISLGVVAILIFLPAFLLIYKKYLNRKYNLTPAKCIWLCTTVCYLVVVLSVTIMQRSGFWMNQKIMPLFYSYKDAWVDFSVISWRNIILNICMFVPLGILLPMGIRFFRSFWKVALTGFLLTVFIEVSQLLLKRGMFELDDLMDNTLGAMIGYGIYVLGIYLIHIFRKTPTKEKMWYQVLALQLPLIFAIGLFSTIFISYHCQELGNVGGQYLVAYDTDKLQVSTTETFSNEQKQLPVYVSPSMSKEEIIQFAKTFFENLGTTLDESQNDFYENTAVFRSTGPFHLWVEYADGSYEFTDFDTSFSEDKIHLVSDATEEELRTALLRYDIIVPEEVHFESKGKGYYTFTVNQLLQNETMLDGEISFQYYDNGCVSHLNNTLVTYSQYKNFTAISEKEAYEMICEGKFRRNDSSKLNIEVGKCTISYVTDSKGFYQPTYIFSCKINGEESQIQITAII